MVFETTAIPGLATSASKKPWKAGKRSIRGVYLAVPVSTTVRIRWFPATSGTVSQHTWTAGAEPSVLDLLTACDVAPDMVLVVRDGRPIPIDATLSDGDEVRIVRTVSGG